MTEHTEKTQSEKDLEKVEKRRRLFFGGALVFAFVAIAGGVTAKIWEPDWNHGGLPKSKEHPGGNVVEDAFNPKYVMLLYLDIEDIGDAGDLRMRAVRLQFPSQGYAQGGKSNMWEHNKVEITNWINCLNKGTLTAPRPVPSPTPSKDCEWPNSPKTHVKKEGLERFIFNQAHHFVIYIQNRNIEYHETDPAWFGRLLAEKDNNNKHKRASKNWSFFASQVLTPRDSSDDQTGDNLITGNNSLKLIYMKNFYKGRNDFGGGYHDLEHGEKEDNDNGNGHGKRSYSLSINASLPATTLTGTPSVTIPIILDPDTGNQGGGEPT